MGARPSHVTVQLAGMMVVTAALLVTASCGTATQARPAAGTPTDSSTPVSATQAHASCGGFSLSLVSDRGGQPSPVAAAEWLTGHGGVGGLPQSGWHEDGQDESGSIVRSGDVALHVLRGPDGTWQVDSGSWC
jgi:hypothetical protein